MFGNEKKIAEVAAEFSGTFGLRGFPGKSGFFVNVSQSYVDSDGEVQLYVYDEYDRSFAKATADELRRQIVGRIEG